MGDDIREIETQNRALQILNSNQHSLISELDGLLVNIYTKKKSYFIQTLNLYVRQPFLYPVNALIVYKTIPWIQ